MFLIELKFPRKSDVVIAPQPGSLSPERSLLARTPAHPPARPTFAICRWESFDCGSQLAVVHKSVLFPASSGTPGCARGVATRSVSTAKNYAKHVRAPPVHPGRKPASLLFIDVDNRRAVVRTGVAGVSRRCRRDDNDDNVRAKRPVAKNVTVRRIKRERERDG